MSPQMGERGAPSEPMKGDENRYLVLSRANIVFEVRNGYQAKGDEKRQWEGGWSLNRGHGPTSFMDGP